MTTSRDPIETVYVQFEASLDDYFDQVDDALSQTKRMVQQSQRQQPKPFQPFDFNAFGDQLPRMRRGLADFLRDMNKAKAAQQDAGKTSSFWSDMLGKVKGSLGNVAGQTQGLTSYMKGLGTQGGQVVQTLMGFARGQASIQAVTGSITQLGAALGPVGAVAAVTIGGVVAVVNELRQRVMGATADLVNMFSTVDTFGVQTGSLFEKFTVQFETLLGSTEAAQERIAEYAEFGATTPFELPGVVQAGKLLQTFGGDMLATGETLTMVGDMAASSGAGFQEIAMWVGRAYTAIQSGRPFGEAAARLQELGLLGGPARQAMEDMQKQGASTEEMWTKFTDTMAQFNGMMDKQSQTYEGMTSNLADYREQIALVGGASPFEEEKRNLQEYLGFLEQGSPFEEAAGRIEQMKAQLEEGDSLGFMNTLDRMQELGMLTDQARDKMVSLQQQGASTDDILSTMGSFADEWNALSVDKIQEGAAAVEDFKKSLQTQDMTAFNESIDQMVEMGVMTEETAQEVQRLREEGASIPIILDAAGVESNKDIIKSIAQLVGDIKTDFTGFMNVWKQKFLDAINLDTVQDMMDAFRQLSSEFTVLRRIAGEGDLATEMGSWVGAIAGFLDMIADNARKVITTISQIATVGRAVGAFWDTLWSGMSNVITEFAAPFAGKSLWEVMTGGVSFEMPDLTGVLTDAYDAMGDEIERGTRIMAEEAENRDRHSKMVEKDTEALKDNTDAVDENAEAQAAAAANVELASKYTDDLIEIQRDSAEQRGKIESDYNEKILAMQAELGEAMNEAADKRMEALQELEADTEEQINDIHADTAKRRQDIEEKYEERRKEKREDAQREERQAEEDHQREMDRMRRQYMDDLEDAVANRDAVAIRDLRERYQEESSQAEENFSTEQQRKDEAARLDEQREDQQKARELQKLVEQEQEKINTINEKAEERRVKIEETYQVEQTRAQERYQEQLAKENERYTAEQTALDQALAKKLESIMQAMAKDKEVTEEGAKAVLEALNEVFGAGGDVDALMEDFANRRRTKMEVQIAVERIFMSPFEDESATQQQTANQAAYAGTDAGTADYLASIGAIPDSVSRMATGGLFLSREPTLIQVGEQGPELLSVSPVSSLGALTRQSGIDGMDGAAGGQMSLEIAFSGSAPPGVGVSERDQIAGAVMAAFRQSGWTVAEKVGT